MVDHVKAIDLVKGPAAETLVLLTTPKANPASTELYNGYNEAQDVYGIL
jgi:hypothetical protein